MQKVPQSLRGVACESRSRAPEGERALEADELRRLRTLACGARRARGAGSWRHELASRGIGWMRLSALCSLLGANFLNGVVVGKTRT